MKRTWIILSALLSLVAFPGIIRADGSGKALTPAASEQGKPLQSIACPDPCNFEVRSRDEKELIALAKAHAKKVHKMALTDQDLKAMIKPVN